MFKLNRKGQNTLEYVLLITAVVAAFLAIQYYLNRGLQGRVREASDNIGGQFDAPVTEGYQTTTRSSTTWDTNKAGVTRSQLVERDEETSRTGFEEVDVPAF